jgi:hypothetical protein
MAQVPKPNQQTDLSSTKPADVSPKDISVDRLIDDGLMTIYREIKNLLYLSSKGKLDAANARDLRDTVKLLFDLQAREKDSLRNLTDEQLKEQAKVVVDET